VLLVALFAGLSWGVFARVWMRFISTDSEFSWAGSLIVVGAFACAVVGQAGVYLARRSERQAIWFVGLRVVALITLLPLGGAAGAFAFPLLLLVPLAAVRTGWPWWIRGVLGALALVVAGFIAALFFGDLGLLRGFIGTLWFLVIYAGLAFAVCFSLASRHDRRFG
jgi:hypothetical protein